MNWFIVRLVLAMQNDGKMQNVGLKCNQLIANLLLALRMPKGSAQLGIFSVAVN